MLVLQSFMGIETTFRKRKDNQNFGPPFDKNKVVMAVKNVVGHHKSHFLGNLTENDKYFSMSKCQAATEKVQIFDQINKILR